MRDDPVRQERQDGNVRYSWVFSGFLDSAGERFSEFYPAIAQRFPVISAAQTTCFCPVPVPTGVQTNFYRISGIFLDLFRYAFVLIHRFARALNAVSGFGNPGIPVIQRSS